MSISLPPPLGVEAPLWAAYRPDPLPPPPFLAAPGEPLVSIVTPSYNQGHFIGATIASVLGQSHRNLELWVIDGGSTDETLDVVRSFAGDPRLRWLSEADRGQADAINKGWARCRGAVLAWLNSDDTYLPHAVATQVAALAADPAAGAVYGDARYVDATGRPLGLIAGRPYSPEALLRLEIPVQPTVFLRRELAARVGPLDVGRRFSMDSDYWARCISQAPFRQTRAELATYRLHGESKTVAQPAGFYAEWLAIAENFFAARGLDPGLRAARPAVLADIYAAIANLEAAAGRPAQSLRYTAYAVALAGPRPRMLKLPLALLDRALPLGLAARASELWGRMKREG